MNEFIFPDLMVLTLERPFMLIFLTFYSNLRHLDNMIHVI